MTNAIGLRWRFKDHLRALPPRPRPAYPRSVVLPSDSTLLALRSGALLVSRSHAVFCRVPAENVPTVKAALRSKDLAQLSPALLADLERHGFFSPPRPAPPPSPSVQLQLTNACNLRCSYCCTNSGRPRAQELGLAQFMAVACDVRDTFGPNTRVALLGGEPLAVPWAPALGEHILSLGLSLTLFTNGLRLADPGVAAAVARLTRRGAEVRVSLAAPDRETCDRLSDSPRFDPALQGIHALAQAGGTLRVDLMLLPQHVDLVAERLPALRRRLPEGTPVSIGVLYRSGREQGQHLFSSRQALEGALDQIAFGAGELIPSERRAPLADRREGCSCTLGHQLHVRSDGALFTCFKMEEQVGHLAETRFRDAAARVRARPAPAASLRTCRDCSLATLCGGGCRAENLLFTGEAAEPVCGPWRVQLLCELLAEDRIDPVDWPLEHLLAEAHRRGIDAPAELRPLRPSFHSAESSEVTSCP